MTSGAAHLMGNLVPSDAVYSSSMTNLARPKSATFIACLSPTRQFRAAWRYEHKYTAGGNEVGAKMGVLCKLYTKLWTDPGFNLVNKCNTGFRLTVHANGVHLSVLTRSLWIKPLASRYFMAEQTWVAMSRITSFFSISSFR